MRRLPTCWGCFLGKRRRLGDRWAWGASVAALLDVFLNFGLLTCETSASRGAAGVRTGQCTVVDGVNWCERPYLFESSVYHLAHFVVEAAAAALLRNAPCIRRYSSFAAHTASLARGADGSPRRRASLTPYAPPRPQIRDIAPKTLLRKRDEDKCPQLHSRVYEPRVCRDRTGQANPAPVSSRRRPRCVIRLGPYMVSVGCQSGENGSGGAYV